MQVGAPYHQVGDCFAAFYALHLPTLSSVCVSATKPELDKLMGEDAACSTPTFGYQSHGVRLSRRWVMDPEIVFMWTGKLFWVAVLVVILLAAVVGAISGLVWAFHEVYRHAGTWLAAQYVMDPANREKIKNSMGGYHHFVGIPADKLNDWLDLVWENRDKIEAESKAKVSVGRGT